MSREPAIPFPFDRVPDEVVVLKGRDCGKSTDLARILTESEVVEMLDKPTGTILVEGAPMAYWLPPDKTLEGWRR
jgi:hypothetical protein